ncbi:MAG TPA: PIN domain-containing protein [Candidatus Limnocylindrales bacterium]|nr:PIN domain-containing protein [Candidatus Limnocylindrales bacterium]
MTAYLDSSVLLRIMLGQSGPLKEWKTVRRGVASAMVEVECLRTLDRLRVRSGVADVEIARRRETVFRLLETIEIVEPTRAVLARASQPLPTELGTLDAIHLATAMLWRESNDIDLVMATHDLALGIAARSCGLRVIGIA